MTRTQKPTYDVVTPLDVDYLDAFGEATEEDRAHWDRARAYGREVLERIDGHWDRAEYPLDLVARAGERVVLADADKFGHRLTYRVAPIDAMRVVTDVRLDATWRQRLGDAGCQLDLVDAP